MNEMLSPENAKLVPRYPREYLQRHLAAAREVFSAAYLSEVNLDYSPRSTTELDKCLPDNLHVALKIKGEANPSLSLVWAFFGGLGGYFGDVLVRNMSGRWIYPNLLVRIIGLCAGRPDWIYRRWYVAVARRKIPVFVMAMRRLTLGKNNASLSKAYEEIANSNMELRC
jgi:hypothetical protein